MILRRALLIALVLLSALQIPGCATPAQLCDVRDYQRPAVIPASGKVTLTWEANAKLPPNTYEWTACDREKKNCHIQLAAIQSYSDVCKLHDLAHGILHGIGSNHE